MEPLYLLLYNNKYYFIIILTYRRIKPTFNSTYSGIHDDVQNLAAQVLLLANARITL